MSTLFEKIQSETPASRQNVIIRSFTDHYADLIARDPAAWRGKFRKMSQTPLAFYRGSAPLFYVDVSRDKDVFENEKTGRVWIQGDLHAENFGTTMNGKGVLVFDVNDYDESYVAPFTWDVKRLCASLALIGYQKAMSDSEIREIVAHAARSYALQVAWFARGADKNFALTLHNTEGAILQALQNARSMTRFGLLDRESEVRDGDRRFRNNFAINPVDEPTWKKVEAAMEEYFATIPQGKRRNKMTYQIKDIARRKGLGIGSAGLTIYSILLEGETQALENDILISMKLARPAAPAKYVNDTAAATYFLHEGQRTTVSQRALQAAADPFLGYATLDGQGMFVTEISPYTVDLNWDDINDMDDILQTVEYLGQCVAKAHCCSDDDSDQTLVDYSIEAAIHESLDGREDLFVQSMANFGEQYGAQVRRDYLLFVDAFRNRMIPGI